MSSKPLFMRPPTPFAVHFLPPHVPELCVHERLNPIDILHLELVLLVFWYQAYGFVLALALPLLDSGLWLVARQADLDAFEVGRGPVYVDVAGVPVARREGFTKDSAEQLRGGEVCGGFWTVWYEVLEAVDLLGSLGLTCVYAAAPGLVECGCG